MSQKIKEDIFERGISSFIDPNGDFKEKLTNSPEKVVIKFGVDPTRPDIHLGHAVVLLKLRKMQDLGAKVIFLIGDFTSLIGDPTGKSKVRPEIDQKEVEKNMKTYLAQVGKILKTDKKVFSWIRNSDWFLSPADIEPKDGILIRILNRGINPKSLVGKTILFSETRMQKKVLNKKEILTITMASFLRTLRKLTHARLIERDMFQDRLNKGDELFMHEMMYPVLQGVDSYALSKIYGSCDLEIGGNDQTFNMMIGRDVMKMNNQSPQAVMAMNVLVGTDGKEKMSKSLDNYIAITDEPWDMYGKIMSIGDSLIGEYFELCTFTPLSDIEQIKKQVEAGENPKELKMRLAREIVSIYHGEEKAKKAEQDFINKFQKKDNIDNFIEINKDSIVESLLEKQIVSSRSDLRRLVSQGAIKDIESDQKIENIEDLKEGKKYKIGAKNFVEIK